ncbi:hypothetical protein G6M37_05590, partial [Agrobacterium tumefaciens]|nr:hypothetical protein [Agrobacterium tumefaciens]
MGGFCGARYCSIAMGGGGADTFVFTSGNGTDLIMDFSANDTIRLNG